MAEDDDAAGDRIDADAAGDGVDVGDFTSSSEGIVKEPLSSKVTKFQRKKSLFKGYVYPIILYTIQTILIPNLSRFKQPNDRDVSQVWVWVYVYADPKILALYFWYCENGVV